MKSIIDRVTPGWLRFAGVIFIAVNLSGCFMHYYKVDRTNYADVATITNLANNGKYFILHANNQSFALTKVKVNNESLEGDVEVLPEEHTKYLHPRIQHPNKFSQKNKDIVLYEVHVYAKDNSTGYKSHVSLPVKDLYQLDVYELDGKATKKSQITSVVGMGLTAGGIIAIIAIASEVSNDTYGTGPVEVSGCSPQVRAIDGAKSELAGILYSGAIFAPLQRTDYLPLHGVEPVDDKFRFQINGNENEELFIHETKLLSVAHGKKDRVLVDRDGKILVYQQPVKPKKALVGENQDVIKNVSAADENYYSFNNHVPGQNTSDIILDFKKPVSAHSGKLIVRAKNSAWGSYLFKRYKSLYGDYYPTLLQQKDKADRKKLLQCELDQSLPLSVSVKENNAWKSAGYFFTPGNEMYRDMIMEIDLAAFKNTDHVQIKLETTYMFWDLDYVGMDFSENLSYKTTYVDAGRIAKSGGIVQMDAPGIVGNDVHLASREHLDIDFDIKPVAGRGLVNSYFLVGNGYYHDNTQFEGKPQLTKIAAFSQKGAFDKFSRQTFDELLALIKGNANNSVTLSD